MSRPWTREEMVLTLDHYLHNSTELGKNHAEVIALARLLDRTPDTISIRFMNYRARDPKQIARGLAGMRGGGAHVDAIWDEFASRPEELRRTAAVIRSYLAEQSKPRHEFEYADDFDADMSFPEGSVAWVLHKRRERDPRLVREAKRRFTRRHGRVFCEACGFDFEATYGSAGKAFIEAHHDRPISELSTPGLTNVQDISLLCANCHRIIHRRRPWLAVSDLRTLLNEATPIS